MISVCISIGFYKHVNEQKLVRLFEVKEITFFSQTNLMLLRVSRSRSTNATLLIVASTNVRVDQLNKKVQLLNRLVKENGGEFQTKKKKKKKDASKTVLEANVRYLTD